MILGRLAKNERLNYEHFSDMQKHLGLCAFVFAAAAISKTNCEIEYNSTSSTKETFWPSHIELGDNG